jgi:hypothetical protein
MRQMYLSSRLSNISEGSVAKSRTALQTGRLLLAGLAAAVLVLAPCAQALADSAMPTRTTLTAQSADSGMGETLSATVVTATGSPVSTGTVDFDLANGQSLGAAIVQTDGTATLSLTKLPASTTTSVAGASQLGVTAVYNAPLPSASSAVAPAGAASAVEEYTGSRSAVTNVATLAATPTTPGFLVTASPATLTVTPGTYGTTVLTVASVLGYAGSIQLSCSGLPAQVTCAFNPTQANLTANGTLQSTLQISTQAPSGTSTTSLLPRSTGIALALVFPGALALLAFGRRYRGIQMLSVMLLVVGTGLGLSGCSQRYDYLKHAPTIAEGTPAGTYTISIAVDGSQGSAVTETPLTIMLVVQ